MQFACIVYYFVIENFQLQMLFCGGTKKYLLEFWLVPLLSVLFELLEYNLITLVCHILILSLAMIFLWANTTIFINKYLKYLVIAPRKIAREFVIETPPLVFFKSRGRISISIGLKSHQFYAQKETWALIDFILSCLSLTNWPHI